jgi:hypothetical protein
MRVALDNTVVALAPAVAFMRNYLFPKDPAAASNKGNGQKRPRQQPLPFGNEISTVFVTNCPVTGAFLRAGLTNVSEDADAESGGLQAMAVPGSVNRLDAMVASARQVAWGWFGVLGGADSWRDAALAHGITGFLVDLFVRSACGDAQFRLRIQQHHDLLLAAASSLPLAVHIPPSKRAGGINHDAEDEMTAGSAPAVSSPATCSLLSFDRVHVPLIVARADPRRQQLPPLIYDANKRDNQAAQDAVETSVDWGSSGDALRVTAARATLLLHSLVQRTEVRGNISYDVQSRFVQRALRTLAINICANTKPLRPSKVQLTPHSFAPHSYKSGYMSLRGFVKNVVGMQNRDLDATMNLEKRKLASSRQRLGDAKRKHLEEMAQRMRLNADVFEPWMRGTSMPRLKCGFVVWDDEKTQAVPVFQAVAMQKPLVPPAGSPAHPNTSPGDSLQIGWYSASGHDSNNLARAPSEVTADALDGASNSKSDGSGENDEQEVMDITESFKRKRFEALMQEAVDLTEKKETSRWDGEELGAERSNQLSLRMKVRFHGDKYLRREDITREVGHLGHSAARMSRTEIRALAFRSDGSLVEQIRLPLAPLAYQPFPVPPVEGAAATASKKEIWRTSQRLYNHGWAAVLDPDLSEMCNIDETSLNYAESTASVWHREIVRSHSDPIAQGRALRELARLPRPDPQQQRAERLYFEEGRAGWKRVAKPDLTACLVLASCLDIHMEGTSAEHREVARLEEEAKDMMKQANLIGMVDPATGLRKGTWHMKKKAVAAAEAAMANAERRRVLLVHPFAGMHVDVRCQAAKAMARWQNEHAPWLPNETDELPLGAPVAGDPAALNAAAVQPGAIFVDDHEDLVDEELIALEADAAMMVDDDEDALGGLGGVYTNSSAAASASVTNKDSVGSPKKRKKNTPSLWPGLDILIATFRKSFMDNQENEMKDDEEDDEEEKVVEEDEDVAAMISDGIAAHQVGASAAISSSVSSSSAADADAAAAGDAAESLAATTASAAALAAAELAFAEEHNIITAASALAKNAHQTIPSANVFADELLYSFKIALVQAIGSVRARNGR